MERIVSEFLSRSGVDISKPYVEGLISNHPDFPSLLSISDTLHKLGVAHKVLRIASPRLVDLQFPYLVPLDKGRGDLLAIYNKMDLLKFQHEHSYEWSGIVLLLESVTKTPDNTNNELVRLETRMKYAAVACALAFLSIAFYVSYTAFSMTNFGLLFLATLGAGLGVILIAKELGYYNQALNSFCGGGVVSNCDKVIQADVTILGLKLPELVLIFFSFQVVVLLFFSGERSALIFLELCSLLSLLVVIFSIYYQYTNKTWCRLCLLVDIILLAQAFVIVSSIGVTALSSLTVNMALPYAGTGFSVFAIVIFFVSNIERADLLRLNFGRGNNIKHKDAVFRFLLAQERKVDVPALGVIKIGDASAPVSITIVSNLYCNPCKKKHQVLAELYRTYPSKVNLNILLVRSSKEGEAVPFMFDLCTKEGQRNEDKLNLLEEWYELMDLKKFEKQIGICAPLKTNNHDVEETYKWIESMEIRRTPTFFVNGYFLPSGYEIDDLVFLVPSFAENTTTISSKDLSLEIA